MRVLIRWLLLLGTLPAPAQGSQFQVSPSSVSSIARFPPELAEEGFLNGTWRLHVLGDSLVLVPQPRQALIRVFTINGAYVRDLGRPGSGPGEFQAPAAMGQFGDTIFVIDNRARRVSFFSPQLDLIADFLYANDSPLIGMRDLPVAQLSGTSYLALPTSVLDDGEVRRIARIDRASGTREEIAAVRGWFGAPVLTLNNLPPGGQTNVTNLRLMNFVSQGGAWAVAPSGRVIAVAEWDEIESGAAGTLRLQATSDAGEVIFVASYPYRGEPVPRGIVDSLYASAVASIATQAGVSPREANRALRREAHIGPTLPPVTQLVVGNDSSVWFERALYPDHTSWTIVDKAGVMVTRIDLPRGRMAAVSEDGAWLVRYRESGEEYIEHFRVVTNQGSNRRPAGPDGERGQVGAVPGNAEAAVGVAGIGGESQVERCAAGKGVGW